MIHHMPSQTEPFQLLWERLKGEDLASIREELIPQAEELIRQFNNYLSFLEGEKIIPVHATGKDSLRSEEFWLTDAEQCSLLLNRIEKAIRKSGNSPSTDFYRLGMRHALLVASVESDLAEYFQRKFNEAEMLITS